MYVIYIVNPSIYVDEEKDEEMKAMSEKKYDERDIRREPRAELSGSLFL